MLTKEQKWMNRLKRCLADIPNDCELLVNFKGASSSEVSLLAKGTMEDIDDFMFLRLPDDSEKAESFYMRRVTACSENI